MNTIHTITKDGYTIKIWQDDDPPNPRDWDNLSIMLCEHRRYQLGDKDAEQLLSGVDPKSKSHLVVPLYLYDHGGITMSTTPFSCPWDSGQVGIAVVTKERMLKEYDCERITKYVRAKALAQVEREVKTYDQYLRGACYGYTVEDADGEEVDSLGGIYQDEDPADETGYLMTTAMDAIEVHSAETRIVETQTTLAEVWP